MTTRLTFSARPVDAHLHVRQGDLLRMVAPITAQYFSYAVIMPNTQPAISTPEDVQQYRAEIVRTTGDFKKFIPLMTFKILPAFDPRLAIGMNYAGAVAGKVYPKGLTTNAEDGVDDFFALFPVFEAMQNYGLVLCLHGEMPGNHIEGLDRERAFLRTLSLIARTFPRLKIVLEHITTDAAVETVLQLPNNVSATITVHHLLLTHDDVGADRMRPHNFCKPVAKARADRDALIYAATSGCPKFFFGSDSAPHSADRKESAECCAGCFTAPVCLPLLAEIFERHNALDRLEKFVIWSAATFYRLSFPMENQRQTLTLVKKPMKVPDRIGPVVPFWAGQEISWSVEE